MITFTCAVGDVILIGNEIRVRVARIGDRGDRVVLHIEGGDSDDWIPKRELSFMEGRGLDHRGQVGREGAASRC